MPAARVAGKHSTFIPGLKKVLSKLKESDLISTIVPGRLYNRGSGSMERPRNLGLRFTTYDMIGSAVSLKILASKGSQMQEFFIVGQHNIDKLRIVNDVCNLLEDDDQVRVNI